MEWILLNEKYRKNYLTTLTLTKTCNTLLFCSSQKQDKGKNHNIYEVWAIFWCSSVFLTLKLCVRFLVGNRCGMFFFFLSSKIKIMITESTCSILFMASVARFFEQFLLCRNFVFFIAQPFLPLLKNNVPPLMFFFLIPSAAPCRHHWKRRCRRFRSWSRK